MTVEDSIDISKRSWHDKIRSRPCAVEDGSFFASGELTPPNLPGVAFCFISIQERSYRGVPPGVYISVNVPPDVFFASREISFGVISKVCWELRNQSVAPPVFGGGQEIDLLSGITWGDKYYVLTESDWILPIVPAHMDLTSGPSKSPLS
jgi:hypothetical protein